MKWILVVIFLNNPQDMKLFDMDDQAACEQSLKTGTFDGVVAFCTTDKSISP